MAPAAQPQYYGMIVYGLLALLPLGIVAYLSLRRPPRPSQSNTALANASRAAGRPLRSPSRSVEPPAPRTTPGAMRSAPASTVAEPSGAPAPPPAVLRLPQGAFPDAMRPTQDVHHISDGCDWKTEQLKYAGWDPMGLDFSVAPDDCVTESPPFAWREAARPYALRVHCNTTAYYTTDPRYIFMGADVQDHRSNWTRLPPQPVNLTLTEEFIELHCGTRRQRFRQPFEDRALYEAVRKRREPPQPPRPNVVVITIDSVDRPSFFRRFHRLTALFHEINANETHRYFLFHRMRSHFFNTRGCMTALFGGYHFDSSDEKQFKLGQWTGGRQPNCLDHFWRDLQQQGYLTFANRMAYGREAQKLQAQMYDVFALMFAKLLDTKCYGPGPPEMEQLHFLKHLHNALYRSVPKFLYFHLDWLHENPQWVELMDGPLAHAVRDMLPQGNTIFIIHSDHGHRRVRPLQSYMSYVFPAQFMRRYPQQMAHFQANQRKMVSYWDHYLTIADIVTNFTRTNWRLCNTLPSRATSLFDHVDPKRACGDMGLDPFVCPCSGWTQSHLAESKASQAVRVFLEGTVNPEINAWNHSTCRALQLSHVTEPTILEAEDGWLVQTQFSIKGSHYAHFQFEGILFANNTVHTHSATALHRYDYYQNCTDHRIDVNICVCSNDPVDTMPTAPPAPDPPLAPVPRGKRRGKKRKH